MRTNFNPHWLTFSTPDTSPGNIVKFQQWTVTADRDFRQKSRTVGYVNGNSWPFIICGHNDIFCRWKSGNWEHLPQAAEQGTAASPWRPRSYRSAVKHRLIFAELFIITCYIERAVWRQENVTEYSKEKLVRDWIIHASSLAKVFTLALLGSWF